MAYKDILFEMEIQIVASWRHFHRSMNNLVFCRNLTFSFTVVVILEGSIMLLEEANLNF